MLVLTRKANESIVIAGNITVTVLGVDGNRVRIGIDAPREVPVDRDEVARRVRQWAGPDATDHHQRTDGIAV